MNVGGFFRTVATVLGVAKTVAKRIAAHTEIVVPEKAINVCLELGTKRDSPIQKPHVVIHDKFFELKFFMVQPPKQLLFCVLPLRVAHLVVDSEQHVAVVERAGDIQIVSGSMWQAVWHKTYQVYLNSRYGETRVLNAIANSVDFVRFMPAFKLCGDKLRPAALRIDLEKILKQHHVAARLMEFGITDIIGISSLREEEGQFVLKVKLGGAPVAPHYGEDYFGKTFPKSSQS